MKLGNRRKHLKQEKRKEKEHTQLMLLDNALKKLVELNIAVIDDNKYTYSLKFECTAKEIIAHPPSKLKQIQFANDAGRKLIPELLTLAATTPTRRDIENMMTGYVCLKIHINKENLQVDTKIIPDLAYAIWYLNDHEPTIQEVEEWNLTSPT